MHVLVCGPESSGTRLTAEIVEKLVPDWSVHHRSLPHGGRFGDFRLTPARKVVWVTRSLEQTIAGQIRNQHSRDAEHANGKIRYAWLCFFQWITREEIEWIPVSYESLVLNRDQEIREIGTWLGMTQEQIQARLPKMPDLDLSRLGYQPILPDGSSKTQPLDFLLKRAEL